jgi:uncharacterized membrane protein YsdA (DUF1294 family)/cold shock CspA family protein
MRKQGKVISWKDDKGFGFIEPSPGGKQIFVHIKAFRGGSRRPTIGTEVSYVESKDAQGRARAERAQSLGQGLSLGPASKAFIATSSFLLIVAAIVALGLLPQPVLWLYLGMSLLTFAFYAMDKAAAKRGGQRTPESTLHTLALVGGWPGALYAQQLLRHKSSKESFRVVFWFTLVLNIAGFGYLVSDYGTWLVEMFQNLMR